MRGILAPGALKHISIHQLLRRNFIERVVLSLKVCLVLPTLALIFWGGNVFVMSSRQVSAKINEFEDKIESTKNAAQESIAETKQQPRPNLASSHNLFVPVGVPTQSAQPTAKPASVLPMTLIGTFISGGQPPYAIIEEQKKKNQDVFNIGDSVFGEAKLVSIYPDYVEIERNAQIEVLSLDSTPERTEDLKGGVAALGDGSFVVDGAELDRALENLPLLLTQARAVPFFKEGRAVGLRLFAIKNGSLFEKIGLQNGDVLKAVNGNSLADLSQALQLFQKLKEERSITLTMERNMVEKELKYEIR